MIGIGLREDDSERSKHVRELLVRVSFSLDQEIAFCHIENSAAEEDCRRIARRLQICLISLHVPDALEFGQFLARENPELLVLYYGAQAQTLNSFLPARPAACFFEQEGDDAFCAKILTLIGEFLRQNGILCYTVKRETRYLPLRQILYLESRYKYVTIHRADGSADVVYGQLDAFLKQADQPALVRIHKSYCVNGMQVCAVLHAEHTVVLTSGDELPISKAFYASASERLRVLHAARG